MISGFIAYIFFISSIYINGFSPFVFGDEAEYAVMSWKITNGDYFIHGNSQYGPLFPLLLSLSSTLFEVSIHLASKVINILCWLVSCYLTLKICENIGAGIFERWLGFSIMLVAPFWSFGIVVWADPLFYSLFFVQIILVLRDLESHSAMKCLGIGIFSGLMFLAKPIGLFYIPGLLLSYSIIIFYKLNNSKYQWKIIIFSILQISGSAFIIISPWIARNYLESGSLLGYNYASKFLYEMFIFNWFDAITNLIFGFFYQLSYLVLMSFGFLGVLIYLLYRYNNYLSFNITICGIYIILSIITIIIISDLHMAPNPNLNYYIPNGRYYSHFAPLIFIFTIRLLFQINNIIKLSDQKKIYKNILIILLFQALIVLLATPLLVLTPYSFVNNSDLGLFWINEIFPFDRGLPWRANPYAPSYLLKISTVLIFIPLIFLAKLPLTNLRYKLTLLCVFSLYLTGSVVQFKGISMMQDTQKDIYSLFTSIPEVCKSTNYFDISLSNTNAKFIYQFLCPNGKYIEIDDNQFKDFDSLHGKSNYLFIDKNNTYKYKPFN